MQMCLRKLLHNNSILWIKVFLPFILQTSTLATHSFPQSYCYQISSQLQQLTLPCNLYHIMLESVCCSICLFQAKKMQYLHKKQFRTKKITASSTTLWKTIGSNKMQEPLVPLCFESKYKGKSRCPEETRVIWKCTKWTIPFSTTCRWQSGFYYECAIWKCQWGC